MPVKPTVAKRGRLIAWPVNKVLRDGTVQLLGQKWGSKRDLIWVKELKSKMKGKKE
ncbi:MAG: hypothetical protein NTY48_07200 [Candidatus Diapherotrites archaeon]|nr:hypothetical protein [Candidatus Diapherotrites archaeon]